MSSRVVKALYRAVLRTYDRQAMRLRNDQMIAAATTTTNNNNNKKPPRVVVAFTESHVRERFQKQLHESTFSSILRAYEEQASSSVKFTSHETSEQAIDLRHLIRVTFRRNSLESNQKNVDFMIDDGFKTLRLLNLHFRMLVVTQQWKQLFASENEDDAVPIEEGAILLARVAQPHLTDQDIREQVTQPLDAIAREVKKRMATKAKENTTSSASKDARIIRETLEVLHTVLFDEWGFRGNHERYYDRENSYLNKVITNRMGIPITMSVVYMAVCERLGIKVHGVNMPAHFLLKLDDCDGNNDNNNNNSSGSSSSAAVYIDAFNGTFLTAEECKSYCPKHLEFKEQFLATVSNKQLYARMIRNLINVHMMGLSSWDDTDFAEEEKEKIRFWVNQLAVLDPASAQRMHAMLMSNNNNNNANNSSSSAQITNGKSNKNMH